MKKVLLVGLVCLSLTSCKKVEQKNCNCGYITDDKITYDNSGNMLFTLTIRNSCSGNSKTWYFSESVWMDANVGENFCVTNIDSW